MLSEGDDGDEIKGLKEKICSYWFVSIVKRKEDLNVYMLVNFVGEFGIKERIYVE